MQSPPKPATAAPSPAPAETASQIPPMYSPAQLRQLKVAVIAMGVILLLGFAVVIGRIVYLVNSTPRPAAVLASQPAPLIQAPVAPMPAALSLPKGAVVRQLAFSGNRLAVYYEGPGGAGIRILDLATGGQGLTLPIVSDGESRP